MANNSIALLAERVARLVIGLAVSTLIARYLGPNLFGSLSYGFAAASIISGLAALGMDSVLVREFVKQPAHEGLILATSMFMRCASFAIVYICSIGYLYFFKNGSPADRWLTLIVAFSAIQTVAAVPSYWFQAQGLSWTSSRVLLLIFATCSVVRVLLVLRNVSVYYIGLTFTLEAVGAVVISYIQMRIYLRNKLRVSVSIARDLIASSWPIWVAAIPYLVYTRCDQIFLSAWCGQRELGLYSAALRLSEQGYLVPTILLNPILRSFVQAKSSQIALRRQVVKYGSISVILAYFFVIIVWVISPVVFTHGFGLDFEKATDMCRIQVLVAPLVAIGLIRNQVLISEGYLIFALMAAFAAMLVSVLLNVLLIPRWGGLGASWAGVAAQFVSMLLSTWFYPRLRWIAWAQLEALCTPWKYVIKMQIAV